MGVVFQPDFDPRNIVRAYGGTPLRRGQMWLDNTTLPKPDPAQSAQQKGSVVTTGTQWGFQFLYNPSDLQLGYSIDQTIYPPGVDATGGTTGSPDSSANDNTPIFAGPGSSTLSFSLILDRTYECWGGPPPDTGGSILSAQGLDIDKRRGIMVDFEHFEAMLGYTTESPFVTSSPMFVSFGSKKGNFYYGYVTGFSFGVSNWTQAMIPNRGAISNIQFNILPLSKKVRNTGGAATSGYKYGTLRPPNSNTSDALAAQAAAALGVGIPGLSSPLNPGISTVVPGGKIQ